MRLEDNRQDYWNAMTGKGYLEARSKCHLKHINPASKSEWEADREDALSP